MSLLAIFLWPTTSFGEVESFFNIAVMNASNGENIAVMNASNEKKLKRMKMRKKQKKKTSQKSGLFSTLLS